MDEALWHLNKEDLTLSHKTGRVNRYDHVCKRNKIIDIATKMRAFTEPYLSNLKITFYKWQHQWLDILIQNPPGDFSQSQTWYTVTPEEFQLFKSDLVQWVSTV